MLFRSREKHPSSEVHERIMSEVEKALLRKVLQHNDFVQTQAADELGLSRNTLRRKIREYEISRD